MRILLIFTLITAVLVMTGCTPSEKSVPLIYSIRVPKSSKMILELEGLEKSKRLLASDRKLIEQDIASTQRSLGVPEGLLWCLLFTKSQLDSTKNMFTGVPSKGIGQLTQSALAEINYDRDFYDSRTSTYYKRHLHLGDNRVDFSTHSTQSELRSASFQGTLHLSGQTTGSVSSQSLDLNNESYFRIPVGVFTSAVYLNNRYQQLKTALDRLGVTYDPVILWFFATAAYESGMRPVYSVLTHELMSRGDRALSHILSDMGAAQEFLTKRRHLEYSFRRILPAETLENQIQALTRTMDSVISCVLPEHKVL